MTQPTPYERQYDLSNDDGLDLRTQVDVELDDVARCFLEVISNLSLIQRDDGALANKSVGVEQLKAELIGGFNPPEPYQPYRPYNTNDSFVTADGRWMIVITPFTGDLEPPDSSDPRITLVYDFSFAMQEAVDAQQAAETAQAAAELARDQAQAAATSASNEATSASQSAISASNDATSASQSADAASGSADSASQSATASGQSATASAASATSASQSASTATNEANRAESEADRAEGFASGLNLPSAAGNGGEFLRQKADETGLEYAALGTAAAANLGTGADDVPKTSQADARYARLSGPNDFDTMPKVGGADMVESDSNNDGEWTRWADGTQHSTRTITGVDVDVSTGGVFTSGSANSPLWTYPVPFIATARAGSCTTSETTGWGNIMVGSSSSEWRVFSSSSSSNVTARLFATGRWK